LIASGGQASAAAQPREASHTITWGACPRDVSATPGAQVECATIDVPVDWTKRSGHSFPLTLARTRETRPSERIGSLLVDPGGPGGSGVDFAARARERFSPELMRHFDVVGFDPRGVGRSHPVRCDSDLLDHAPAEEPTNREQYQAMLAFHARLSEDCRRHTGPLFDHVDTVATVRDMDAIRGSLGEEKISYYGVSYGTQIGQQYAELFPDRLRAMVIDSNMDHSLRDPMSYLVPANRAFEGSFNQFADWCERTSTCALYGKDVRGLWDALYRSAERGQLTDPGTGERVTAQALRTTAFGSMYQPQLWFDLAKRMATLAASTAKAPTAESSSTSVRAGRARPAHGEFVEASYQAIWCEDWHWDVRSFEQLRTYHALLAAISPHTRLTGFWADVTGCLHWHAKVDNPQHRLRVNGAPPILMTNSRYDVATPYEWAADTATQLPSAVLLTYDGVGHRDYQRSPCARAAIDAYLIDMKMPPRGAHCPAVWPTATAAAQHAPVWPEPDPARPMHR